MTEPLDAARALAPRVRACAAEIEAARELPRPLFEALADAGLFHLLVPRSLGGREIDPPTYIQVIEELGKADASTAWAVNQGAVYATYAARMPLDAARAIWIDTPRAVVANTPAPTAIAVPVAGRLSRHGAPGLQHRLPACRVAGRACHRDRGEARRGGFPTGSRTPAISSCPWPRASCWTPGRCAACAGPAPITSR